MGITNYQIEYYQIEVWYAECLYIQIEYYQIEVWYAECLYMEGDATILCTMTNEPMVYGLHASKDDKEDTKKHLAYRMSGDMIHV